MSTGENEAIIRRYVKELNERNFAVLDELVASFVSFAPGETVSRDQYRRQIAGRIERWPGYHVTIDDVLAEGGEVRIRWTFRGRDRVTGDAVTGHNTSVYVLENGQIVALRDAPEAG